MRCDQLADRLTELLEGELTPQDETAALEHLAGCPACEQILGATREASALAADHGRVILDDEERTRLYEAMVSDLTGPRRPLR